MMNVNRFTPDRKPFKRMLRQNFLKSVIILDQLCQSSLGNIKQNCYEDELESASEANYITCH